VSETTTSTAEEGGSPAARKREQLLQYTRAHLAPHRSVSAVVAVGSVATGLARADSDIDAVVFMDPLDLHVAPAEAIWRPTDDTYHSIFDDDESLHLDGIQLDLTRLDLTVWRKPEHHWPEHLRAALADGWVAFDRTGRVSELIADRTSMSDQQRRQILDDVLVSAAGLLRRDPFSTWTTLGPAEAFDRLQAAYEELVRGVFASNRTWRPWRGRALRSLSRLDHLPPALRADPQGAVRTDGATVEAYRVRFRLLALIFDQLIDQLCRNGLYGPDAVSEAFIRLHDEPGRAWNIDEWSRNRTRLDEPNPPTSSARVSGRARWGS
jgi:hypothetical protein